MPGLLSNEAAGRQAFIFRDGRPMIRPGDSKTPENEMLPAGRN